MTAQEYPAQLPQIQIPADPTPGEAPVGANDVESAPSGMPNLNPTAGSVQGSMQGAMAHHEMMAGTTEGMGGHVGVLIPNMPDPQMSAEMNAMMGMPERAE